MTGPPGFKSQQRSVLELADHLNCGYISSGDLLTKEISKKTELGSIIKIQIEEKRWVDDNIVTPLIMEKLKEMIKENKKFILEGFPRTRA